LYDFHTIPYIIYTEITRNYQKLRILIKEITYICYGIFRPKLIVIMPANFIIYNLIYLILKTSEIYLLK